jgi:transcriptional regulator
MYIPSKFKVDDAARLVRFMQENSFATVITQVDDRPFASHLPLLFEPDAAPSGKLLGHMARANPQWQHFADGREVLIIFHGRHAYISPRWYKTAPQVPTWNYVAVHAYGKPRLIDDRSQLEKLLDRMIRFYEGDGPEAWRGDLPTEYKNQMMKAIVGFEIAINRLEGKFKLGQNREKIDVAAACNVLERSDNFEDKIVARLMREENGLAKD